MPVTFLSRDLSTTRPRGALRGVRGADDLRSTVTALIRNLLALCHRQSPDSGAVRPATDGPAETAAIVVGSDSWSSKQECRDGDRNYAVLHYEMMAELAALDRRVRDLERVGRQAGGDEDGTSARVLTLVPGSGPEAGR